MKRITLSTSSSGLGYLNNIPHRVEIIPLHLLINNVDFIDGQNITPDSFRKIVTVAPNTIARTSPASEAEVTQIFENLVKRGYQEVFICTISSKFSKSYEILQKAKRHFAGKLDIYLYDSLTLNLGEGALAYEADCLMQEGWAMEDIAHHLNDLRSRHLFLFTLSDLSYIIRNKKLSTTAGFVANLLNIKPIMHINQEGYITPYKKVRGIEQTLHKMIELTGEIVGDNDTYFYVANSGSAEFDEMKELFIHILDDSFGLKNPPVVPVSTISLANHGPKGIGIGAFYGKLPKIVQHLQY